MTQATCRQACHSSYDSELSYISGDFLLVCSVKGPSSYNVIFLYPKRCNFKSEENFTFDVI